MRDGEGAAEMPTVYPSTRKAQDNTFSPFVVSLHASKYIHKANEFGGDEVGDSIHLPSANGWIIKGVLACQMNL